MRIVIFAAAALVATAASAAEEARFQLERTDTGIVRLDTVTGALSYCTEKDGGLDCRDASGATTDAMAALESRLAAAEARIAALEKAPAITALPSEEEVDRAVGYMERFLRSFLGVARDLEREFGNDDKTAPSRT